MADRPAFTFDHDLSVADFDVSKHSYLAARPGASFGYIAASTIVLGTTIASHPPRLLLLQRVDSDEDPNMWEVPGGACDDSDATILHAAARELWEETGLVAARFVGLVGDPHFFTLDDGKKVCQFNFAVLVKSDTLVPPVVMLNPDEHQRFVWATEGEIRKGKAAGLELVFTRDEVKRTALLAFDHLRGEPR